MFSFRTPLSQHPFMTLLLGSMAILLVLCIISYPGEAFQASLQGLEIWWDIIFPALLPFLVLSEMLYAYGLVHGLGIILDPLMRLLFRIPGIGGWVWSVGWTAGYPAGAKAVIQLRKQQSLSRKEAECLLSLSHTSSPIFIIAVIGTGFMQQTTLGFIITIVHWVSAIATTLLLQFIDYFRPESEIIQANNRMPITSPRSFYRCMFHEIESAQYRDGRSFGKLLGDSVSTAVQTLMMMGGYMMIFSVIIQAVATVIPHEIGKLVLNGLLEVNLGTYMLSSTPFHSSMFQAALIGAIIGWSGLSTHLHVHSLIKETDLRFSRFLLSRLLHAISAFLLTYALWIPLQPLLHRSNEAMAAMYTVPTYYPSYFEQLPYGKQKALYSQLYMRVAPSFGISL